MKSLWMWLMMGMSSAESLEQQVGLDRWFVVNDTVMGGVSQSTVEREASGAVSFSGVLSLANNGGFTSTRAAVLRADWREAKGLLFKVKGDGRSYIATVRLQNERDRRVYYRQQFETEKGVEEGVVLPFSGFQAYAYGQPVRGAARLETQLDQVGTLGVMLADKKPGPFSLEIRGVFVQGDHPKILSEEAESGVYRMLQLALLEGVPLFNSGRPDLCADIYEAAIERGLSQEGAVLGGVNVALLTQALRVSRQDASQEARAWTLRRGIDEVMLGMSVPGKKG